MWYQIRQRHYFNRSGEGKSSKGKFKSKGREEKGKNKGDKGKGRKGFQSPHAAVEEEAGVSQPSRAQGVQPGRVLTAAGSSADAPPAMPVSSDGLAQAEADSARAAGELARELGPECAALWPARMEAIPAHLHNEVERGAVSAAAVGQFAQSLLATSNETYRMLGLRLTVAIQEKLLEENAELRRKLRQLIEAVRQM